MPLDLNKFLSHHMLGKQMTYQPEEVLELCRMAKKVLEDGSPLARVCAPCVIVGDIHGHFEDLLRIFQMVDPSSGQQCCIKGSVSNRFVFLGSYIDRGPKSLETICLLLGIKCKLTDRFTLLRGCHEIRRINHAFGFWDELVERFGEEDGKRVYDALNEVFDYLPMAALVGNRILCVHGGISPELTSLKAIESIPKPLEEPEDCPLAHDLLWADPMPNLRGFQENTNRGTSYIFGEDMVKETLKKLNLDIIVRSNLIMKTGSGFFAGRGMATIYSNTHHHGGKRNVGTFVTVSPTGVFSFMGLPPSYESFKTPARKNSSGDAKSTKDESITTYERRQDGPDTKEKIPETV